MTSVCTTGVSSIKRKKTTSKSPKPKRNSSGGNYLQGKCNLFESSERFLQYYFFIQVAVQSSDSDSDHESKDVQVQKNTIAMQTTSRM